jgi:hypothetical protein
MELIRRDVYMAVRAYSLFELDYRSKPVALTAHFGPSPTLGQVQARMGALGRLAVLFACVAVYFSMQGCALIMPVESGKPTSVYASQGAATAEAVWLGMHALDTAQTVTIARSPACLREADHVAATIYGSEHPSESRVLVTNVALGALHYYVGGWLDRGTERALADPDNEYVGLWYVSRGAFYVFSFLGTGIAVTGNASMGIKPFSHMTECGE